MVVLLNITLFVVGLVWGVIGYELLVTRPLRNKHERLLKKSIEGAKTNIQTLLAIIRSIPDTATDTAPIISPIQIKKPTE